MQQRSDLRSSLNSTGDRSDKIRTYNFPQVSHYMHDLHKISGSFLSLIWQDRVTDHRVGVTVTGVARVLSGEMLTTITQALMEADESERVANFLAEITGSQRW